MSFQLVACTGMIRSARSATWLHEEGLGFWTRNWLARIPGRPCETDATCTVFSGYFE